MNLIQSETKPKELAKSLSLEKREKEWIYNSFSNINLFFKYDLFLDQTYLFY